MPGKWLVPVVAVAVLVASCSNKSMLNEKDPFDDPFFSDGVGSGTRSLNELMREPAPNVGWLAHDGPVQSRPQGHGGSDVSGVDGAPEGDSVLLEAENEGNEVAGHARSGGSGEAGQAGEEGELVGSGQKSAYDQASEATMATMSVLFGLGMAALPFLIGT